jgi:hypothetical protein
MSLWQPFSIPKAFNAGAICPRRGNNQYAAAPLSGCCNEKAGANTGPFFFIERVASVRVREVAIITVERQNV